MTDALVGRWKCVEVENFDDFLKILGVGFIARKVGASLKPTVTISYNKSDNKWQIDSESSAKNTSISFEIGKEFEEESPDGSKKIKSLATIEGNKMVQTQTEGGKIFCVVTREVNEKNEQVVLFKADQVVAKRVFKRDKE